ncbi:hypothetical protein [Micromonospora sp. DT229]|uniref:hypothetical protein n=1 Tax=Micromonospora sp. DT229 TaxID=3393430 RepID=UPI003CEB4B62
MPVQSLELVAPSAAVVNVELAEYPRVTSVAAHVRFASGAYGRGFQIGPRGYHEFACTYMVAANPVDRLVVHGREVVVSESLDKHTSVATLIGDYHELMTVFGGPAPRREKLVELFSTLEIADQVRGMVLRPRRETLLGTMSEHIAIFAEGLGSLSIPGPGHAAGHQPRHQGARTQFGEVWRSPLPGVTSAAQLTDYTYTLGFPSAMAEVVFADGDDKATDADKLSWLEQINVSWAAG